MLLLKPRACKPCAAFSKSRGFLPVAGTGRNKVLLVGLRPSRSETEAEDALWPYSEGGTILFRACAASGLDVQAFARTNLLQCPAYPTTEHISTCATTHLKAVIDKLKPRLIVALGAQPTEYLTGLSGHKATINHLRGFVVPGVGPAEGYPVKITYDPEFIKEGNLNLLNCLAQDLALSQTQTLIPHEPSYVYGIDEAKRFYEEAKQYPELPIAFDIETPFSLAKDEDDVRGHVSGITQIQFSMQKGKAVILPWTEAAQSLTQLIMRLPNPKLSWNGYAFDVPRLEEEGVETHGTHHDLMWMWHHLEPDLPMNLSFVTGSFVGDRLPPWKHTMLADMVRYGGLDVDALVHLWSPLVTALEAEGLYKGYEEFVLNFWPILSRMSKRGLPIDPERRAELREWIEQRAKEVNTEIQEVVPPHLFNRHPKDGYKNKPKPKEGQFRELEDGLMEAFDKEQNKWVPLVKRPFGTDRIMRWCRLKPFLVNSPDQLKRYCEDRGITIPKTRVGRTWKISLSKEICQQLADKHDDPLFTKVVELRELEKVGETYIEGWPVGPDNAVHSTYHFGPASGQLGSREPNVQNVPKWGKLAKPLRKAIKALPDKVFIEIDMTAFHAKTLGYCAQDAGYMRIAGLDIHSYVAAHLLHLPEADKILDMPDAEAMDILSWIKKTHTRVRNKQAKPAILGIGFGMGVKKLFKMNPDSFDTLEDAKVVHDMLKALFPRIFTWQNETRKQAWTTGKLITPFNCVRRFYDVFRWDYIKGVWDLGQDGEACIAFPPSNIAHMHMRQAMHHIAAKEYDERYGLCNMVHDSLLFHCPKILADECVENIIQEMSFKSSVLVDPIVAPEGFSVNCEAEIGPDWASMQTYRKE